MSAVYADCLTILKDKKDLSTIHLDIKWIQFKKQYPKLYDYLIKFDSVDLQILKFMCELAENHNELSKEEQLENEFKVGDTVAKKYLYNDKYKEPSNVEKELIKENIREKMKEKEKENH